MWAFCEGFLNLRANAVHSGICREDALIHAGEPGLGMNLAFRSMHNEGLCTRGIDTLRERHAAFAYRRSLRKRLFLLGLRRVRE